MDSVFERYDLNRKVDLFMKQYEEQIKESKLFLPEDEFYFPKALRNFIESKAVYSELRFPSVNTIGLWMPLGFDYDNLDFVFCSRYKAHFVVEEIQKTIESMEKFPWNNFEEAGLGKFSRLNLMDYEINDSVLLRIIERGGPRVGPRRGIIFAKEFGLDINVPISYAIDWDDDSLYDLLDHFYDELDFSTLCPVNYFARNPNKPIDEISLETVMETFEGPKEEIKNGSDHEEEN